jgi:hypothetical protein
MNENFPGFCNEAVPFYTDDISDVGKFFPNNIIQRFVITRADIVTADI